MTNQQKEHLSASLRDFHLPRYDQIPTVGLYLEQTSKFLCEYLAPIQEGCITSSMISNYVKMRLISSPVKKQYSRDQIAHLMFISLAKRVMSLDNLCRIIRLQEQTYSTGKAYDYFCDELENYLAYVFGQKAAPDDVGSDNSDEKMILRNTLIAVSHSIYLEKWFQFIQEEETE